MKKLSKLLHSFLPSEIISMILKIKFKIKLKHVQEKQKKTLQDLHYKNVVTVLFFISHEAEWKYEGIYRQMLQDKRFDPWLVVIPYIVYGEEIMKEEMKKTFTSYQSKGYRIQSTFHEPSKTWVDIHKQFNPDVIFFSSPHKLTKPEYYITNFPTKLNCYVPYGFMTANIQQVQFNLDFHNLLWKAFYETPIHKMMAEKYARNKGMNVEVTGYPMCDIFINPDYSPVDVWKIKDRKVKRIIWAPHHTIEQNDKELAYSNFLSYHQFMLDLPMHFKGTIQITFKPHPILKPKLYEHPEWGKEKTDSYYNMWEMHPYGQLMDGRYEDLFLTSDAMILDSTSFIGEYFFTKLPSLFMVRDQTISNKFNEFGKLNFDLLYKSYHQQDIIHFIEKVVIEGDDTMYAKRMDFLEKVLLPPHHQFASTNIMNILRKELFGEETT